MVNFRLGYWGQIVLSPGQVQEWWFTWGFQPNEWAVFDASPDTKGCVQILNQWATNEGSGVTRHVTFKNCGTQAVAFRPKVLVALP